MLKCEELTRFRFSFSRAAVLIVLPLGMVRYAPTLTFPPEPLTYQQVQGPFVVTSKLELFV
jgi:hypothetical protein